jgi:hypothetical protein
VVALSVIVITLNRTNCVGAGLKWKQDGITQSIEPFSTGAGCPSTFLNPDSLQHRSQSRLSRGELASTKERPKQLSLRTRALHPKVEQILPVHAEESGVLEAPLANQRRASM